MGERKAADESVAKAGLRIESLVHEAGCEAVAELPECERRSALLVSMQKDREEVEQYLAEQGGPALDDLVAEASKVDENGLPALVAGLDADIAGHEKNRSDLDQVIGSERKQAAMMQESSKAAEQSEAAAGFANQIREAVDRYLPLQAAAVLLSREIERYRCENQGPILVEANRLFPSLTRGSFIALKPDYGDGDEATLVGIRANGKPVRVEGMSDGTLDQLHLALRLATLGRHMQTHEPMPLILDDVLINFDDRRAKATLEALGEMASRTQVIFLTHHPRLCELAAAVVKGTDLFVHELDAGHAVNA